MAEEDKQYTRFITHSGSFEYNFMAQGLCNAGDGYTKRYDDVTQEFNGCSVRVIDGTCIWAGTPEDMFNKICVFLSKTGTAGMLYKEAKFQYCQNEVEYLGFSITENGIYPGDDMVNLM